MRKIIGGTVLALVLAGNASAGTIKLKQMLDKSRLTLVKISNDSGATFREVRAGQIGVRRVGGTDPIQTPADTFFTYCVETMQQLSSGTFLVQPLTQGNNSGGPLGVARAAEIEQLFARFQPSLYASVDKVVGAAIQLAIWEIADENGNGRNLSTGTFRVTGPANITLLAQSYLDALTSNGPRVGNLFVATSKGYQDLLLQGGGSSINVAEPASLALLALGLGGLVTARRRARR